VTFYRVGALLPSSFLKTEEASEHYCNEVLDGRGRLLYLDREVRVTALAEPPEPIWVPELLENQYRRFLNDS